MSFASSGIVPHGKGCRKCLPLTTMQELVSADGRAFRVLHQIG
jgi:hypothetical protein